MNIGDDPCTRTRALADWTRPRSASSAHRLGDRVSVPAGDRLGPFAECGLVGQVLGAARDGPRPAGVGDQDADVDAVGDELPAADLVQRLLHHSVQGLAGEPGEVDRHLGLLERALDVRAQGDCPGCALADEDPAALPGDDQALIAQQADGLLDRHAGNAVTLG